MARGDTRRSSPGELEEKVARDDYVPTRKDAPEIELDEDFWPGCCRLRLAEEDARRQAERKTMSEDTVTQSSGNVSADAGLPDAETHLVKAELVSRLDAIIRERGLRQREAARMLKTTQPDLSNILRGRFRGCSVERLMRMLTVFDCDVSIVVAQRGRDHPLPSGHWHRRLIDLSRVELATGGLSHPDERRPALLPIARSVGWTRGASRRIFASPRPIFATAPTHACDGHGVDLVRAYARGWKTFLTCGIVALGSCCGRARHFVSRENANRTQEPHNSWTFWRLERKTDPAARNAWVATPITA
jgi:predicted XRE-type DNA-binding protein